MRTGPKTDVNISTVKVASRGCGMALIERIMPVVDETTGR